MYGYVCQSMFTIAQIKDIVLLLLKLICLVSPSWSLGQGAHFFFTRSV